MTDNTRLIILAIIALWFLAQLAWKLIADRDNFIEYVYVAVSDNEVIRQSRKNFVFFCKRLEDRTYKRKKVKFTSCCGVGIAIPDGVDYYMWFDEDGNTSEWFDLKIKATIKC